MGDIADMMMDGLIDKETGELIDGEAPGYPRKKRIQYTNKRWSCDWCDKWFTTRAGYEQHQRDKHGKDGD